MRSYFPRIRDGWYIPSGGHFYYGIQAGSYFLKSGNTGIGLILPVAALGFSWLPPTDYSANPHPLPWFQIIRLVVAVTNEIR
jgi:hypothetical protein